MAGEMRASLTLSLRDQLSTGIEDIREAFQSLNRTLSGMTDVLADLRNDLATLRAPTAMMAGIRESAREAITLASSVGDIGKIGAIAGQDLKATLGDAFSLANGDAIALISGIREIGVLAQGISADIKGGIGDPLARAVQEAAALNRELAAAGRWQGPWISGPRPAPVPEGVPGAPVGDVRRSTRVPTAGAEIAAPGDWGDLFAAGFGAMFGLDAIKDYATFYQPLGHTAITEGLKGAAVGQEVERIISNLQPLALATGQLSQELAEAYFSLEQTPLKNQKGLIDALMPILAQAGTAYNVPVPEMGQAVYALADVMKVPKAQMLEAFGELAYATKMAHFNMAAFGDALPRIGGQLQLFGAVGLPTVNSLAAVMETVVQNVSNVGDATTAVSELLHYIASPMAGRMFDRTKRSWDMLPAPLRADILKYHVPSLDIGALLASAHAQGEDPISALLGWLHQHLAAVPQSQLPVVLGAFMHDATAQTAIASLLEHYADFQRMQKKLGGITAGTVKTDFATAMQFPEVQVKLFEEEFAQITRIVGADLVPMLKDLNFGLKGFLDEVHFIDREFPGVTETVVQAVALGLAFKGLAGAVDFAGGGLRRLFGVATSGGEGAGAAAAGAAGGAAAVGGAGWAEVFGARMASFVKTISMPEVAIPALVTGTAAELARVNEAAARQAAKIWSENAKATLSVTVQTNESGLPLGHDPNAIPLLLHFAPAPSNQMPGSSPLGLVLGRK